MIRFHTIKAGDRLYDVRRTKMGHTTMSQLSCWPVDVISVDIETRTAVVRWNSVNRPETYRARQLERLRRSPPRPKKGGEP